MVGQGDQDTEEADSNMQGSLQHVFEGFGLQGDEFVQGCLTQGSTDLGSVHFPCRAAQRGNRRACVALWNQNAQSYVALPGMLLNAYHG